MQQNFYIIIEGRQRERKERMSYQKGFSLVELMIVIALMGIMAAIATPALQKYAINRNLKSAARDITSDFLMCKARAIAENTVYRIVFDKVGNSYEIGKGDSVSPFESFVPPQIKYLSNFGSDIEYDIGSPDFTFGQNCYFQTRGTVTNRTLVLKNSRNSIAKITTNITGRTYVDFNMQ